MPNSTTLSFADHRPQPKAARVNLRYIDWIWQVRGTLALAPGQTADEVLTRLEPLFDEYGTSHERIGDTLTYRKKDQAAQDRMATFDSGELTVVADAAGPVLRYRLASRMLLFCFLLPLLFVGFGQLAVTLADFGKPTAAEKAKKEKEEAAKAKTMAELPQHAIDKFLGAPKPEIPKKDEKKAKDKAKDGEEESPATPAYVLAGLFALLYLVGRVFEARKMKSLFRKRLFGE